MENGKDEIKLELSRVHDKLDRIEALLTNYTREVFLDFERVKLRIDNLERAKPSNGANGVNGMEL